MHLSNFHMISRPLMSHANGFAAMVLFVLPKGEKKG